MTSQPSWMKQRRLLSYRSEKKETEQQSAFGSLRKILTVCGNPDKPGCCCAQPVTTSQPIVFNQKIIQPAGQCRIRHGPVIGRLVNPRRNPAHETAGPVPGRVITAFAGGSR